MAVRNEAVRLSLEDDFSRKMLQAAAATKALQGSLKSLDGTAVDTDRSMTSANKSTAAFGQTSQRTGADINKLSGRLSILARVAATLGPAIAPIGAVAVAGVGVLGTQVAFATVGIASLVTAFQGMGKTFEAVQKAALEPTVENLQAARDAMSLLAPEAQAFVTRFQELRPVLLDIRNGTQAGWFPGLTESLDEIERVAPYIERLFYRIGKVGGNLAMDATSALAGPEWENFRTFLMRQAPAALDVMGRAVGNLAKGLANLFVAFGPVTGDFNNWLLDGARSFERWTASLRGSESFEEFIGYLRENGPLVGEAFVAIANAILQIVEAAAPLGGPVLEAITGIANAIAAIADSPLGTPIMVAVTGLSAMSLAARTATASVTALNVALGRTALAGGAAGASSSGLMAAAGPAGIAGLIGLLNVPDFITNLKQMRDGEQGVVEGLVRMAAAGTPTGAVLQALGVDILGVEDAADELHGTISGGPLASGAFKEWVGSSAASYSRLQAGARLTAAEIRGLTAAMLENRNANLSAFDAVTRYREALKAARAQANKNNAGIQSNSKAALENRNALSALAAAWNNQSAAVRNNVGKFREARSAFIETATAMGVPEKAARDLARELLGIPRSHVTKVNVDGAPAAVSSANAVERAVNSIPPSKTSTITVYHRDIYQQLRQNGVDTTPTNADGGTIFGRRQPYGDKVLSWLAPGEEVISNRYGQADRHRALLKAINSNRYAAGGTIRSERSVGRSRSSSTERRVLEVRVVGDALDLTQAKQQIRAVAREVSRDEIDQDRGWTGTQG